MKLVKVFLIFFISVILFSCSPSSEEKDGLTEPDAVNNNEQITNDNNTSLNSNTNEQTTDNNVSFNSIRPVYSGTSEEISEQIEKDLRPFYNEYSDIGYGIDIALESAKDADSRFVLIDTADKRIVSESTYGEYDRQYGLKYEFQDGCAVFVELKTPYSEIREHFFNYFSPELTDKLFNLFPYIYVIINDTLYYREPATVGDPNFVRGKYFIKEYTDTKIIYGFFNIYVDYGEGPSAVSRVSSISESPDKLVREYIGGKWVFTEFSDIY